MLTVRHGGLAELASPISACYELSQRLQSSSDTALTSLSAKADQSRAVPQKERLPRRVKFGGALSAPTRFREPIATDLTKLRPIIN